MLYKLIYQIDFRVYNFGADKYIDIPGSTCLRTFCLNDKNEVMRDPLIGFVKTQKVVVTSRKVVFPYISKSSHNRHTLYSFQPNDIIEYVESNYNAFVHYGWLIRSIKKALP